ncbi:hypothetical protein FRB99_007017 [Tulasnella sp. 403]|nr:hypothetical protein FRB99_007017 [Tulasnella sp. 403]
MQSPPAHSPLRRPSPSAALLASIAALLPTPAFAAPILPFLYPQFEYQPQLAQPPRRRRQRRQESPAERLAFKYTPDPIHGSYKTLCWRLHGQSNCPRDSEDTTTINPVVAEVTSPPPDLPPDIGNANVSYVIPSATSTTVTATLVPTSSLLPTQASPDGPVSTETATVKPYTMVFQVENIPTGWVKPRRTDFYPKRLIIGFSISLSILIILTIIGCVIWRVRVARSRRDAEIALAKRKAQIASRAPFYSDSDSDHDSNHNQESTRQRGLRRRRPNTKASEAVLDPPASRSTLRQSTSRIPSFPIRWKRRRKPVKLTRPSTALPDHTPQDTQPARSPTPANGDPLSAASCPVPTRRSASPSSSQSAPQSTVAPGPSLSPSPSVPTPDPIPDEATDLQLQSPPAYRRRDFHPTRSTQRPSTAPAETPSRTGRDLGKEREIMLYGESDLEVPVPDEYIHYAPGTQALDAADASTERRGWIDSMEGRRQQQRERARATLQNTPDDDSDIEYDNQDEEDRQRVELAAHLATDDKHVLERLRQTGSEPPVTTGPSEPPSEDGLPQVAVPLAPHAPAEEDVHLELVRRLEAPSSSSAVPLAPLPNGIPPLPALPRITQAHLFLPSQSSSSSTLSSFPAPPRPIIQASYQDELPKYSGAGVTPPVEKPSATQIDQGLLAVVPSVPPGDDAESMSTDSGLVASAPPELETPTVSRPSAPTYEP